MFKTLDDHTPEGWVSFYFSTLGAAERPESAYFGDDEAVKKMRASGVRLPPTFPDTITAVMNTRDPSKGRQLVIRGDNGTGKIIAEAYPDPAETPIATIEWAF